MEWTGPDEKPRVAWLIRELSTTPGLFANSEVPRPADWNYGLLPAGLASGIDRTLLERISSIEEVARPVWERFEGSLSHHEHVVQLLQEMGHKEQASALEDIIRDLEAGTRQDDPDTSASLLADATGYALEIMEILEEAIDNPEDYEAEHDLYLSPLGELVHEANENLALLEAYAFVAGVLVRVLAESGRLEQAMEAADTTAEYLAAMLEQEASAVLLVESGNSFMSKLRQAARNGFNRAMKKFFGMNIPETEFTDENTDTDSGEKALSEEEETVLEFHAEALTALMSRDLAEDISAERLVQILRVVDEEITPYDVIELMRGHDLEDDDLEDDDYEELEIFCDLVDRVRDAAEKLGGYALELELITASGLSLQSYRSILQRTVSQRLAVVPSLPEILFIEII